ncbi:hypothetical protein PACID_18950 [Acidipropionibacterium acidipropionici ATCC 4875]|uniref:Uncharacterized protein n=1 Tax=Acidipropionibacterium acidipropionici (strain ATCC 4875 / DSM 20272 / JCM 6432 / NBRC 12425 / NCIMB 8070 / 4) TaxID=1171373 RepID=K7SK80_ACIA4|nr:hypothetical protein PACID_18950 [Acidipropionibacterium acidipropionici ATCC 4875]
MRPKYHCRREDPLVQPVGSWRIHTYQTPLTEHWPVPHECVLDVANPSRSAAS